MRLWDMRRTSEGSEHKNTEEAELEHKAMKNSMPPAESVVPGERIRDVRTLDKVVKVQPEKMEADVQESSTHNLKLLILLMQRFRES